MFAGQGYYYINKKKVSGSTLLILEKINKLYEKLRKNNIKVHLFCVEKKRKNFIELQNTIKSYIKDNSQLQEVVVMNYYNDDCNKSIDHIVTKTSNDSKCPLFVLADPSGLQVKKKTLEKIQDLKNPKDILLNYIQEGVERVGGLVTKGIQNSTLNKTEIKAVKTLKEFLGTDVSIIPKSDIKKLEEYVKVFVNSNMKVVVYDMPYSYKEDVIYYLLYMSKKETITKIVADIYYRCKKKQTGQTSLFGEKYDKKSFSTFKPQIQSIKRKSLLYKSKVDYGGWTINHVVGCTHGCRFPCYAFLMAKRFGWVEDYADWRRPKVVSNALELLDNELKQIKEKIEVVHLCFMTDPFMYDDKTETLIPEIKEMTLKIMERLNKDGIRVTTLTKGICPEELLDTRYSDENEYGITLVSLNSEFKKRFEPFSASYDKRISSLEKIAKKGKKTWISMEPYPTPNLDSTAKDIEIMLDRIKFVDKIVFGKLNYNVQSSKFKDNTKFYKSIAEKVIAFCKLNNIQYHIKTGTPLSRKKTTKILQEEK